MRTALQLLEELGERTGELILASPSAAGTVTTLVDNSLAQYLPVDVPQFNAWVYGRSDVASGNQGVERRASSWDIDSVTLALYAPGFPTATTAEGTYEISVRRPRSRRLEAINEAAGLLYLGWWREFIDESITTAVNTWQYQLPSHLSAVHKVEIQVNIDQTLTGYPYADAAWLNYAVRRSVDAAGVEANVLQFAHQPPPGRLLRVFADGYFPDLAADGDVLAIGGKWERAALAWMYRYAQFLLYEEDSNRQPATQAERYRVWSMDRLMRAKEKLLEEAQEPHNFRIIIPGRGDGQWPGFQSSPAHLGLFQSGGLN